ncbi:MAG: ATP-binding protein [Myxococcota bacterium]
MHEGGPELVRRGRTAVLIAWLMGTMFGAVLVMRLLAQEWASAAVDVGLVVACYGGPYLLRWTGRYYEVANLMLGAVFGLLCYLGVTNTNPGLNAATVALAEIPLFAIILFGTRLGYAWSLACALAVLTIGVSQFEVLFTPSPAERAAFNEYWAVLIMCLTLISAGLFYERGKEESLRRMSKLEASRREAELEAVRTQAQAELQQAERFASMGRLAAAVAHEINNPLSFVQGNLAYLIEELPRAETAHQTAMQESLEGVDRIRRIVADLRSFTRPEDGREAEADVDRACTAALSMAESQTRSRAEVELDLVPGLAAACDEQRLAQVILNLVVNAAQALPEGRRAEHRIQLRSRRDTGGVRVEVEDNGPGIPQEIIDRVREPFFTTKPVGEGTGLGLALSEGIVRNYRGSLAIESRPGRTVVCVVLPAVAGPRKSAPESPQPTVPVAPHPALRILICDDEVMVARSIKRHLSGHQVDIAEGGREALDQLEQDAGYDIVFCDIMMPDVTGMDLYEAVRERHPELAPRLVFMSGGTYTERAQSFRERPDIQLLEKPITLD